ncbi:Tetrathionate reductase subunit B [Sporomusa silvacetica DSM 10669]|uniref:Tetrathionate reductase subunit B n=1 Tax=Sporomusa silvacetica DSM 10669 TaxID=1123289 RepID=A0ABZ3ITL0_9FIRM|nr:4Fe-4S dicluster domain-containing protein [Sporomusa silvacetica]OZC19677.1 tetrathionate reductase subunit B precursor [Sporomusa silvacetica DSM 10669]
MRYGMLIDLNKCSACGACVMACKLEQGTPHQTYWGNLFYKEVGRYPFAKRRHIPMACMHCADAPCVKECPTKASYYDENGLVLVDADKCVGCKACIIACPYGARHFNFSTPTNNPYWGKGQEATPFALAKADCHRPGTVGKCTFCVGRLKENKQPACVQTCIVACRIFGDLDDPNSELVKKIHEKDAVPLHSELGTKPSVYYVGEF